MAAMSSHRIVSARAQERQEARDLMTAMLARADDQVRGLVRDALGRSGSLLYVVSHLVDTARQEVEDMWYRGDIGVVAEGRILRQLEVAVAEVATEIVEPQRAMRRCMLAATDPVTGMISRRLMEEDRWNVRVCDLRDIVFEARRTAGVERRLVIVVGEAAVARGELRGTVSALQALGSRVLLVVPGHWAQAGRWQQLGADSCASDARTMLLLARKLHSADTSFSISEVAASLRVTPHTIRAWERRYGLPGPARDKGGQRRYSVEDVQLLLRVSHVATVHGHSLRLAALEAQGLLSEDVVDVPGATAVTSTGGVAPPGHEWRRIADAVPELMMLVDGEGKIVDCNVATARVRDAVREGLRGVRLTDLVIDYDRAKAVRLYRPSPTMRQGWELRLRSGSEGHTVVAFDSSIVAGENGRLLGLIGRVVPHEELEPALSA
jgi:PAS domain-containing protein